MLLLGLRACGPTTSCSEHGGRGDAAAGEALVDRYVVRLSRFFRNKASTGVEDLIQTTLLGLLEGRDRYRGEGSFRAFVFSVAFNTLRTHYRKVGRDAERLDFGVTSLHDLAPGPSAMLGAVEEEQTLLAALRRIPVEHQVLLELYFWEPLSAAEIGAVLGVPEGTVRTRIRRAKALLEQEIAVVTDDPRLRESTLSGLEDWAAAIKQHRR